MSDSRTSFPKTAKTLLAAFGIFVFFGFLVLILSGFAGHKTLEERIYEGRFDEETVDQRWANLEEVTQSQEEALDQEAVKAAMAEIAGSPVKAAKTELVVPGSPTFLKQSQQAAPTEAPAGQQPAPAPPVGEGEAAPVPSQEGEGEKKDAAAPAPAQPEGGKPEPGKPEGKTEEKAKGEAAPADAAAPEKATPETPAAETPAPKAEPAPAETEKPAEKAPEQ